ncbi:Hsp70 family protein [Nonomuraea sp. NPDC055795]
MRKKALIIANQEYGDERFGDLPGAAQDASQLADVLAERAVGEFTVEVVAEGSARTVMKRIAAFFGSAARGDLLLLHMSCHGRTHDRTRELYFVAADTELDALAATGVPASFINEQAEHCRSTSIVLLLDCCYSGTFARGIRSRGEGVPRIPVDRHFAGSGMAVITACSALQFAYENEAQSTVRAQPSIFTSAVVEGLRTGKADLDGDGYISVHDLYQYAREHVVNRVPNQTPEFSVNRLSGTLYLARNVQSLYLGEAAAPLLTPALYRAVTQGEEWERFGATLALDRMLRSGEVASRMAAREALIPLTRDADPEIRERARSIWTGVVSRTLPIATDPQTRLAGEADEQHTSPHIIGIDFGTTNSTVAVIEGGVPQVISNLFYSTVTPSVVGFSTSGQVLVGDLAKRQATLYPHRTVQSVKRKLGTDWSITIGEHAYTAVDIAAYVLERLRLDAEAHLGEPVGGAVITVPATYGLAEKEALQEAAWIAGLRAFRFVNEPTAAAVAYGLGKQGDEDILVFDLGGGTLDVSLLAIGADTDHGFVQVHATCGYSDLGGDDWDERLVKHLAGTFADLHGVDLTEDRAAAQKLREAAEQAKIELSTADRTTVSLPYIAAKDGRPLHLDVEIGREQFESLTADLIERCRQPVEQALRDSGRESTDIAHVVLVGGSTRMPAVARLASELLGGKDHAEGVDPSAAIALGAAVQAGILAGQIKDVLLLDVISTSLGVETKGGVFTKIIERNTTIPTRRSEVFTTNRDNQSSVLIQIYQGEREIAACNRKLTTFDLTGIRAAPRGVPQIELILDVDTNGIINATARDLGVGVERTVTVSRKEPPSCAPESWRETISLVEHPGPAAIESVRPAAVPPPTYEPARREWLGEPGAQP